MTPDFRNICSGVTLRGGYISRRAFALSIWTTDHEYQLVALADLYPGQWTTIATALTDKTGIPFTGDQVRHKRQRLQEATEAFERAGTVPQDEQDFAPIAVPRETYVGPRLAFFDLETTDLKGNFGRLLAGCIADSWGNITTFRYTDYPGKTLIDDSGLAVALRDELEKYDEWVSWNGKLFDVPFLNARLLRAGEAPLRKDRIHVDLMYYAKGQFTRLGSARLENVSRFFRTGNAKTPLTPEVWALASAGDKAALEEIVEHCQADVLVLRDVYSHLKAHLTVKHR